MKQIEDWNTVVTGAGKGIGLELTGQLLGLGARVIATVRGPIPPKLEKLQSESSGRLKIHTLDVLSESGAETFAKAIEPYGHIDLLINNAGVIGQKSVGLEGIALDVVLNTYDTNAVGPIRVTRALLPLLLKSEHPRVAQISSLMGSISDNSSGGYYAYRMSKAALNMFNRCLAKDYPKMICLALHPGWVKTDMGGEEAPTTPAESATGLLKMMTSAKISHSGQFYDYRGKALSW